MRNLKSASQAFKAFLSTAIIEEVVLCTNLFGDRYFTGKKKDWKPVTTNEIWAFIGILIAAGRNHQNHMSVATMWSSNRAWSIDFYRFGMSKNRFKDIYVVLRFDDVTTRPDRFKHSNDRLEPIRKIFDMFVQNCLHNYIAPRNLTIDERLCLFRGKTLLYFLFIPSSKSKPTCYTICFVNLKHVTSNIFFLNNPSNDKTE